MLHLPKGSERQRNILKALANGELVLEGSLVCGLREGAGRRTRKKRQGSRLKGGISSWGSKASSYLGFLGGRWAEPWLISGERTGQEGSPKISEPSTRGQKGPERSRRWHLSLSKNMKNQKENTGRKFLVWTPPTPSPHPPQPPYPPPPASRSVLLPLLLLLSSPAPPAPGSLPGAHVGTWHLTSTESHLEAGHPRFSDGRKLWLRVLAVPKLPGGRLLENNFFRKISREESGEGWG